MLLNIITAVIRPRNLRHILESIAISKKNLPITINWIIVVDLLHLIGNRDILQHEINRLSGELGKYPYIKYGIHYLEQLKSPANIGFDNCEDGLICLIDDDNIMHPNYMAEIYQHTSNLASDTFGFLYDQILGKDSASTNQRIRRVIPYRVGPGKIDTAQITLTKKLLGTNQWPSRSPDMEVACPDGVFIGKVYNGSPHAFKIINKPLCYYNYLSSPNLDFSLNKA